MAAPNNITAAPNNITATPNNITATATLEAAKEAFSHIFPRLESITWNDIPDAAKARILASPAISITTLVATILFFMPALLWSPVILALGVGQVGPMAGGVFAAMQSMFGTNAVMAAIQSAGMGGAWGVGIANGAVQSMAAVVGGVLQWMGMRNATAGN